MWVNWLGLAGCVETLGRPALFSGVIDTFQLMGANPPLGRLQVVDGLQGDGVGWEQPMVRCTPALSVRVCRSVDAGGRPAPLFFF